MNNPEYNGCMSSTHKQVLGITENNMLTFKVLIDWQYVLDTLHDQDIFPTDKEVKALKKALEKGIYTRE